MKLAIVGTSSDLTGLEIEEAEQIIFSILQDKSPELVISGGANGIDKMALYLARQYGLKTLELLPKTNDWAGFKARNMQIAKECDELICITTQVKNTWCYHHKVDEPHQKTAGCWTLREAKNMGKKTRLIVLP